MFKKGDVVRCIDDGKENAYNNPPVGTVGIITFAPLRSGGANYCIVEWFIDGKYATDYFHDEIEHVQAG